MALTDTGHSRKRHYIELIDASLKYLLRQQELASSARGRLGGNPNAGVFMAHAGLWAYDEPASRYHENPLIVERAVLALDFRIAERAAMARDFFSPAPVLEVTRRLKEIDARIEDRWSRAAMDALEEQASGSLHDQVGHWSDWDTFFALGAALAWKLTGKGKWLALASEHIQILRANAVDADGFLHWTTPYETWNPTANYEGLMLANLARYFELTSDPDAKSLIDRTAGYYLHHVEPSGLTDYTPSIFPKHYHENKKDSYSFAAAAAEFLAAQSGDGRYARVCEIMQKNLKGMQRNDGSIDMKPWPVAAFPHSTGLQALATAYLRYAAGWCVDGPSRDLPDDFIRRHEILHGFKGRRGSFSFSVGCNESQVSLMGAANGVRSLVEGVFCMVGDREHRIFGQVGPFWREYACGDSEVIASTAFYHPVLIKVGAGNQPASPWLIRQTWIGTTEMLIGMVSFEGRGESEEDLVMTDIHLGPAGTQLSWGTEQVQGDALVEPENPEVRELCALAPGSWIHYGGLGIHFLDFFGEHAGIRIWDGVKGEMLHRSASDLPTDFNTVVSNDAIVEFSAGALTTRDASTGTASKVVRRGILFTVFPSPGPEDTGARVRSAEVRQLPAWSEGRRQIAFRSGNTRYIAVITHQTGLETVPIEFDLPSMGPHAVSVHAHFDAPPIRSTVFNGGKLELAVLAVSPVVLVRISKKP